MEGAILSHLSGSTRKGDVHLAFHWLVPSTSATDEPCCNDPDYDNFDYEKVEPISSDSTADAVETRNTDNDQTADYIDPNDLDQTADYIDPNDLDQTADYIDPDDLYL